MIDLVVALIALSAIGPTFGESPVEARRSLLLASAIYGVFLVLALAAPVSAIDVFWTNPGSGDWNTPENWENNTVPIGGFGDVAVIDNGGTASVTSTPPDPVAGIVLGQTAGGDGAVTGDDFLAWQRGFGNQFDAADLADWEAGFGSTSAGGAVSAVPEPNAWLLALLALGGLVLASAQAKRRVAEHAVRPRLPTQPKASRRRSNSRGANSADQNKRRRRAASHRRMAMNGRSIWLIAIAATAALSAPETTQGQSISLINADFELPGTEKDQFWTSGAPDGSIPGWVPSGIGVAFGAGDSGVENGGAEPTPIWRGYLNGMDPSIYQTTAHNIVADRNYRLEFDAQDTFTGDVDFNGIAETPRY